MILNGKTLIFGIFSSGHPSLKSLQGNFGGFDHRQDGIMIDRMSARCWRVGNADATASDHFPLSPNDFQLVVLEVLDRFFQLEDNHRRLIATPQSSIGLPNGFILAIYQVGHRAGGILAIGRLFFGVAKVG